MGPAAKAAAEAAAAESGAESARENRDKTGAWESCDGWGCKTNHAV